MEEEKLKTELQTTFKEWWENSENKANALNSIDSGKIIFNGYIISFTSGHTTFLYAYNDPLNKYNSYITLYDFGAPDTQKELIENINKKLAEQLGGRRRKSSRKSAFKVKSHRNRKSYKSKKSKRRH